MTKLQQERMAKIRKVLSEATFPIGPTEIARRINEPWCVVDGAYPQSSKICPMLDKMGDVVRNPMSRQYMLRIKTEE